ncbi:hypothetical protein ACOMHN_035570 [Nucella lapillus]
MPPPLDKGLSPEKRSGDLHASTSSRPPTSPSSVQTPPPPSSSSSSSSSKLHHNSSGSSSSNKVGQSAGSCAASSGGAPARVSSGKMGNGASHGHLQVTIDGETFDVAKLKVLIPELRRQIRDKDNHIQQLSSEVQEKDRLLQEQIKETKNMTAKVDKLKSVLQQKVPDTTLHSGKPDILDSIAEDLQSPAGGENRSKRQGVSGESPSSAQGHIELKHVDKDFRCVLCVCA